MNIEEIVLGFIDHTSGDYVLNYYIGSESYQNIIDKITSQINSNCVLSPNYNDINYICNAISNILLNNGYIKLDKIPDLPGIYGDGWLTSTRITIDINLTSDVVVIQTLGLIKTLYLSEIEGNCIDKFAAHNFDTFINSFLANSAIIKSGTDSRRQAIDYHNTNVFETDFAALTRMKNMCIKLASKIHKLQQNITAAKYTE